MTGGLGIEQQPLEELENKLKEVEEFLEIVTPIGEVKLWTSETIPPKYRKCEGQAISRTTFATLFAVIGTKFGEGDKSTTFNVPNLTENVPMGPGATNKLATKLGEALVHLTEAQLPSHFHTANGETVSAGEGGTNAEIAGSGTFYRKIGRATSSVGSGNGHNNIQPSLVLNFIIRVE